MRRKTVMMIATVAIRALTAISKSRCSRKKSYWASVILALKSFLAAFSNSRPVRTFISSLVTTMKWSTGRHTMEVILLPRPYVVKRRLSFRSKSWSSSRSPISLRSYFILVRWKVQWPALSDSSISLSSNKCQLEFWTIKAYNSHLSLSSNQNWISHGLKSEAIQSSDKSWKRRPSWSVMTSMRQLFSSLSRSNRLTTSLNCFSLVRRHRWWALPTTTRPTSCGLKLSSLRSESTCWCSVSKWINSCAKSTLRSSCQFWIAASLTSPKWCSKRRM